MKPDDRPPPAANRCKSRRFRWFRLIRCSWDAAHVRRSKWHCDESKTGYAWLVSAKERY